jgi:hypothetical protein
MRFSKYSFSGSPPLSSSSASVSACTSYSSSSTISPSPLSPSSPGSSTKTSVPAPGILYGLGSASPRDSPSPWDSQPPRNARPRRDPPSPRDLPSTIDLPSPRDPPSPWGSPMLMPRNSTSLRPLRFRAPLMAPARHRCRVLLLALPIAVGCSCCGVVTSLGAARSSIVDSYLLKVMTKEDLALSSLQPSKYWQMAIAGLCIFPLVHAFHNP